MRETHDRSLADSLVDILRERLAELEDLEATGGGTPDTCEVLIAVRGLLAELESKLRAGTTLQ
jgi:hypothetical protein